MTVAEATLANENPEAVLTYSSRLAARFNPRLPISANSFRIRQKRPCLGSGPTASG